MVGLHPFAEFMMSSRIDTSQSLILTISRYAGALVDDGGTDGRGYLEKLIADQLRADNGEPAHRPPGSFNLSEIRGVAIGLVAAGALGREEAEQILADLQATLQRIGWRQVVQHQKSTSAVAGAAAVGERAGTTRPEWLQAIENPPTPALRDVIPLVGRTVVVGEVTARLVSLELWSTFLALNLAHVGVDWHRTRERFGSHVRWHRWGTSLAGSGSNCE